MPAWYRQFVLIGALGVAGLWGQMLWLHLGARPGTRALRDVLAGLALIAIGSAAVVLHLHPVDSARIAVGGVIAAVGLGWLVVRVMD